MKSDNETTIEKVLVIMGRFKRSETISLELNEKIIEAIGDAYMLGYTEATASSSKVFDKVLHAKKTK